MDGDWLGLVSYFIELFFQLCYLLLHLLPFLFIVNAVVSSSLKDDFQLVLSLFNLLQVLALRVFDQILRLLNEVYLLLLQSLH